jgi:hypothetical protein
MRDRPSSPRLRRGAPGCARFAGRFSVRLAGSAISFSAVLRLPLVASGELGNALTALAHPRARSVKALPDSPPPQPASKWATMRSSPATRSSPLEALRAVSCSTGPPRPPAERARHADGRAALGRRDQRFPTRARHDGGLPLELATGRTREGRAMSRCEGGTFSERAAALREEGRYRAGRLHQKKQAPAARSVSCTPSPPDPWRRSCRCRSSRCPSCPRPTVAVRPETSTARAATSPRGVHACRDGAFGPPRQVPVRMRRGGRTSGSGLRGAPEVGVDPRRWPVVGRPRPLPLRRRCRSRRVVGAEVPRSAEEPATRARRGLDAPDRAHLIER